MLTKTTQCKSPKSRLLVAAAALTALTAVGCASDDTGIEAEEAQEGAAEDLALQASGSTKNVPNPNGAYFASVTANGTGCRPGTWNTSISPDGQTFTTTFSEYFAEVTPKMSSNVAVKDCQLAIKLHSPSGLSYTVTQFFYQGYAFLEEGVSARQIAGYYFQGNPVASEQIRAELKGPMDDTYLFEDKITTRDTVSQIWSPCGVDRDLNVKTLLRLQNTSPKRTGYINVSDVNGSTKLVFRLNWRKCDAGGSTSSSSSSNTSSSNDRGGRGSRR